MTVAVDRFYLEWLVAAAVLGDICDEEEDGTEEQFARYEQACRWEQRAFDRRYWGLVAQQVSFPADAVADALIARLESMSEADLEHLFQNNDAPATSPPGRPGRGTDPVRTSIAERGTE